MALTLLRLVTAGALMMAAWTVGQRLIGLEISRAWPTASGLTEAMSWDAENPDFFYRRGLLLQAAGSRLSEARSDFQRATELNPYNWQYRFAQGSNHELASAHGRAEEAYLKALSLSPTDGFYQWSLANFYLRRGNLPKFVERIKQALVLRPEYRQSALGLLLKLGVSSAVMEEVWPEDAGSRLLLFRLHGSQVDRAHQLWGPEFFGRQWGRLLAWPQPIQEADLTFYLSYLLDQRRANEARSMWIELMQHNGVDPSPYARKENYIWNGGFELPLSRSPLDWVVQESAHFRGGQARALSSEAASVFRLEFDGTSNPDIETLVQQVVVDPGRIYDFTFSFRSQEITSDQGLFFEIADSAKNVLVQTEPIRGTHPWTRQTVTFGVPADREVLRVSLRRRSSQRIRRLLGGELWLDDIRMETSAPPALGTADEGPAGSSQPPGREEVGLARK